MFKQFFELRGTLPAKEITALRILGVLTVFLLWWSYTTYSGVKPSVTPSPIKVVMSIPELIRDYNVIDHALYSIFLNVMGFIEGVVISLVVGFVLGLYPGPRAMNEKLLSASRYLSLPPLMGIMVALFGIGSNMKIQFLTLGMIVYLIPTVIQRLDETMKVYEETIKTMGATKWQQIKYLYIPDVLSRTWGDIVVLIAITWTYIILAEMVNSSDGGLGSLVYVTKRQIRIDMVYALNVIILLIGLCQDLIMKSIGKLLFPHNYV
jgi:NitT/TauT family transport system permease protein